ncbi:hypothetical protein [Crateriforma conspicua]|uniref:hypothetical protein n=1 Tax=Crateriforma conspicua TaxID=2527996 RepID=UPI00118CF351|nr:hypothetical protein [Crateriforma conspicua]QDV62039.1 recombination protein F [Crateriforma conspicua]
MTLTVEQLRSRLTSQYPDIEQIDQAVVRFTRRANDRAFAICYVDVSDELPTSSQLLDDYQAKIFGKRYFEGRKSLQWSNYLYFVVGAEKATDATIQSTRELIQRDRKYARKFVIAEGELDWAISSPSFQIADSQVATGIVSIWTDMLAAANLDRAVLNDESLPRRLELIEADYGQDATPLPATRPVRAAKQQPFLSSLELTKFREFPVQRSFSFGLVNLVCGPNGTGKTSLFEAVELLYCGNTKRNPKSKERYRIDAIFSDNTSESATDRRSATTFRDRNLAWYGQSEVKTNRLYQSFSQFNFLNTDAAVSLAESDESLEDDLSKLLVGPETSKTWREIERTSAKIADKIKELSAVRNQANLELESVKRQLEASPESKQESNAVFAQLSTLVERAGWSIQEGQKDKASDELVKSLAELNTLLNQSIALEWAGSPVTIDKLERFVAEAESNCTLATDLINQIKMLRSDERPLVGALTKFDAALKDLEQASKLVAAGVPDMVARIEDAEKKLMALRRKVVGFKERELQQSLEPSLDQSVSDFLNSVLNVFDTLQKARDDADARYSKFAALRDESVKLSQQLRSIASQMLQDAASPNTCPLCHTEFPPGELASHINSGVDTDIEAQATQLLEDLRNCTKEVKWAEAQRPYAEWIRRFCEQNELSTSVTIRDILNRASAIQQEVSQLEDTTSQIQDDLTSVSQGEYSVSQLRELFSQSSGSGEPVANTTREALETQRLRLESEREASVEKHESIRKSIEKKHQTLEKTLGIVEPGSESPESSLAVIRERISTVKTLLNRLADFRTHYPWEKHIALSEVMVASTSIRKVASDYQLTSQKEQSEAKRVSEATKRKEQVEKQLAGLTPRIERLNDAQDVLNKIQTEHSLSGAMEEALRQNRMAIEGIFARIHSPPEFSGLGEDLTTLVRKKDGAVAGLQQISTGQRSAFALSLFLAQNAQLRTAPPAILIDDPVAHVDDFNCLSFLDYLRDLVVAGGRQVFFSTANDKLAMLFERKFDFLGEGQFVRFDLRRE